MTEGRLPLSELLEKAGDGDFLRSVAEAVLQMLMEADVDGVIGAGRFRGGEPHSPCLWETERAVDGTNAKRSAVASRSSTIAA